MADGDAGPYGTGAYYRILGCFRQRDPVSVPMIRDISKLTTRRFDVLVIGGGIHGLAIAYDAAQRGLATALVERNDLGSGSSFNHAKTVHGGLRSLQKGDIPKARFSMRERRAIARIAPNFVTPLRFMMATTAGPAALARGLVHRVRPGRPGRPRPQRRRGAVAAPASRARRAEGRIPRRLRLELVFRRDRRRRMVRLPHAGVRPADARLRTGCYRQRGRHRQLRRSDGTNPPGPEIIGVLAHDGVSGKDLAIEARLVISATGAYTNKWVAALGGRWSTPLAESHERRDPPADGARRARRADQWRPPAAGHAVARSRARRHVALGEARRGRRFIGLAGRTRVVHRRDQQCLSRTRVDRGRRGTWCTGASCPPNGPAMASSA